ncbi:MAG TPA: N-acetylneuraminate synthase [Candidatus Methylomirabilis sp.]|nr:N-acetylneuraminate synthase [Candidatus Methylomirabilis sp.]
MNTIEIAGRLVGPGHPCFVIAEAGVNHNGDLALAKRLVEAAATAGADAVKFQTFSAERMASRGAPKAKYQLEQTDPTESQVEMLRRLELSPEAHRELHAYCRKYGVLFLSTPFDEVSADLLAELGLPAFKIGSGEITNWPFLDYIARKGKPIILSTGMSFLSEVDEAVRVIRNAKCDQLALLHCVSNYPADPSDANLYAIRTLAVAFDVPVGYSDHTSGIEVALAATALGACVIEKHCTVNRQLPGPDHCASLEPHELRQMVAGIRTVQASLGTGGKWPASSEAKNRLVARRSVAAACNIPEGAVIRPEMLRALRPASGISPALTECVVGRRARRPLMEGQLISWGDLE